MHNSQDGQPVATDDAGAPRATPYSQLLVSACIGCHSSASSVTIDGGVPIVNNTLNPTNPLAGGNFYYVESSADDALGHNVFTSNPDDTLTTPPGGSFPSGGSYSGQLRCAGTRGCHGHNGGQSGDTPNDDDLASLDGAHHANLAIDGTTVGKSYRFLYGILGLEDSDWEQDNVNTSHNEYQGGTTFTDGTTVSFLCSECHGDYHSDAGVGTATPWLRHPTDVVLPSTGEYASYTTYSMVAPVARPDPNGVADTTQVTPGTDILMCLSCHRAHGSPYFKLVRWDYKNSTLATAISGCNICHTSKN